MAAPVPDTVSVNARAEPLVQRLVDDAPALRLQPIRLSNGALLIDAGVNVPGGVTAGVRIAEICMAGLGSISITAMADFERWPWSVCVQTSHPVLACLGSQYAGWQLSVEHEDKRYTAMASGPARALAGKEVLFTELHYRDQHKVATLVLESDFLPPEQVAAKVADDCGVDIANVNLIVTPTGSLAGGTQIAARVVEVALHKAHELGFNLEHIVDAMGSTPVPPPATDMLTAMGRTNDTILFGGRVQLFVQGTDDDARGLAMALPSNQSSDYGQPFGQIFRDYDYDFFKIDGMLFSPALVSVTAVESGNSFSAGELAPALLEKSFGSSDK
ncbi:MAG: methenyltetrahydromethanopterin cyclohydrolase [Granulosicoccus sp.]|nr:methenyltetrahydromethanopterin cyclohydrolase [Granulosicoccus sp.]